MIKNAKMVLFDVGQFVVIQNGLGVEVSFESFEEFTYFSGVDISSKYQVNYEPMTPVFYDSEGEMTSAEKTGYEVLIGRAVELSNNKNDPYYGKSDQDKKDTAYATQMDSIELRKKTENLKDFPYEGNTYKSDQESIQATQNTCMTQDGADKILTLRGTPYDGCWKAVGAFVPFAAHEFITFATEYFKRGSDNFTTRSTHMANVDDIYNDQSKDYQDILGYNFSTGWN